MFFIMISAWQIILLFIILGVLPTVIALIDILKHEFTGYNKIIWVIVVLFGNLLGAILYFLLGRKQKL